jgi:hypothetical protein
MAPATLQHPHQQDIIYNLHSLHRRNAQGYSISPAAIVLIVILVAGFFVFVGFAIGRFFLKSNSDSSRGNDVLKGGSSRDVETMTQPQYQRWLRMKTREGLMRGGRGENHGRQVSMASSGHPLTGGSSMSSLR